MTNRSNTRTRGFALIGLGASLLALGGCAITDPLEKANYWSPSDANKSNLAAQMVNPSDLVRGQSSSVSNGVLAAQAVDRLYKDKLKELPDTTITINGGGGGSSGSSGGGSAGVAGGGSEGGS